MFQTVNGIGRAISLSIASTIETAVQTKDEKNTDAMEALLKGLGAFSGLMLRVLRVLR
jgi:hypothetical protein